MVAQVLSGMATLPDLQLHFNLQNSLPKVLTFQNTDTSLRRLLHTHRFMQCGLQAPIVQPRRDVLLMLREICHHVLVRYDEASQGERLDDDVHQVLHAVALRWMIIVVAGDHATFHESSIFVHSLQGGVELLAAHVVVVDVDA